MGWLEEEDMDVDVEHIRGIRRGGRLVMDLNVRTRREKLTDRDRTAAGGEMDAAGIHMEDRVYDTYLNVYSSHVHAGRCSGTVKASYFCTNFSVSDTNPFHSAHGGFLVAACWAERGFDQCRGVICQTGAQ